MGTSGSQQPATPPEPPRPRRYRLGRRQEAVARTRERIVAATRALLSASTGLSGFTVDAVARRAGVARFTIYYHFRSKRGLIEALFDDLAARGGVRRMAEVHALPEPDEALRELFAVFGRFWATDRVIMRRVRSLAALDPDLEQAVRARDEWRRNHCRRILERIAARSGRPGPERFGLTVDVLHMLSSFETYDTLAGAAGDVAAVAANVHQVARAAIDHLDGR